MAAFVIIHGAWTGGWSWSRVLPRLHAAGHEAYAPTLTGLAERSHLASPQVNLDTHVLDIVNEIRWKDLTDVVLVAHSYGGFVAAGVLEMIPEKIGSLVLLEAFLPKDGQSFEDIAPGLSKEDMIPPPSSSTFEMNAEARRLEEKATPQPRHTMTQKVSFPHGYDRVRNKTYIAATGWDGPFVKMAQRLSTKEWTVHHIDCGHDVPMEKPKELVALLATCAAS